MVRRRQSSRNLCPIIDDCGARENLFRPEGNNIKAIPLCIEQRRGKGVGTLRLYCIRISGKILIIGNGGIKRVKRDDYQKVKMIIEAITI